MAQIVQKLLELTRGGMVFYGVGSHRPSGRLARSVAGFVNDCRMSAARPSLAGAWPKLLGKARQSQPVRFAANGLTLPNEGASMGPFTKQRLAQGVMQWQKWVAAVLMDFGWDWPF